MFAGGIGESAPAVRALICAGLGFLGIALDEKRMRTDEEWMIGQTVCRVLGRMLERERKLDHEHEKD